MTAKFFRMERFREWVEANHADLRTRLIQTLFNGIHHLLKIGLSLMR
ncbi:hypothetical protein FTUN_3635 [Frigoriglobus tundricola]|uniref:Uncharacterized protein n=1 Tax=Frigoriglobus tundricola TaxID=2774151 RepID=A0A6M5YS42_9BACT|nr:hypothetical protein FTUN_3635 [Frigoriglobus tundricola]